MNTKLKLISKSDKQKANQMWLGLGVIRKNILKSKKVEQ